MPPRRSTPAIISPMRTSSTSCIPYVSEKAQIRYLARVEGALAEVLAELGVLRPSAAAEIVRACELVTPEEVYEEERRIQHNIRALVNCIRQQVSHVGPPLRPSVRHLRRHHGHGPGPEPGRGHAPGAACPI